MAKPDRKIPAGAWIAIMLAWGMGMAGWAQPASKDQFSTLLQQGFEFHKQAHFVEAIPVLERARSLRPGDYFVNLLLGIDLLRTGALLDRLTHHVHILEMNADSYRLKQSRRKRTSSAER